jgi:AICAR transformylase/IMP cyclohydrolase PurH
MVRAAAKNHEHVYVVVDPADYSQLVDVLSGKQSAEEVSRRCPRAASAGRCVRAHLKASDAND